MPITPLDLVKRSETGAALTQGQFDGNLTATEIAVNALIALIELALNADGTPKDGFIAAAAKIADNIVTLAKLSALTGDDKGAFLRANASTGAIEAAHLFVEKQADSDAVEADGAQAGLELSSFTFEDVPAGKVQVTGSVAVKWNAGAAGGTVRVKHGDTVVAEVPTHFAQDLEQWLPLTFFGVLSDFAGGNLTLLVEFETSEGDADLTFGVGGDGRFGRSLMVLAGL